MHASVSVCQRARFFVHMCVCLYVCVFVCVCVPPGFTFVGDKKIREIYINIHARMYVYICCSKVEFELINLVVGNR